MSPFVNQMLCSFMPRVISDQCEDFVAKYGDMIIKMIIEAEMNPDAVCASLSLCTESHLWGE
jgi:hypothetical protein